MQLARWGVVAIALVATALSGEGRITAGSSQIVRLRLVVDTTPVVLSEREGEMARIDIRGEQVLGVIPAIDTCATNGPCLAIVQITLDPATGEETLQDLWHVELKVGQTVRFDGAVVPVEIKLVGISAAGAQPPVPNGPCQKCCVICDGITTCACAVETACGNCCCPECQPAEPPSLSCVGPPPATTPLDTPQDAGRTAMGQPDAQELRHRRPRVPTLRGAPPAHLVD